MEITIHVFHSQHTAKGCDVDHFCVRAFHKHWQFEEEWFYHVPDCSGLILVLGGVYARAMCR